MVLWFCVLKGFISAAGDHKQKVSMQGLRLLTLLVSDIMVLKLSWCDEEIAV